MTAPDRPRRSASLHSRPGARPAARRGTTTWLGIRSEIMDRISHRIYPPGEIIPTEQSLAAEFGCARATVNRALASLASRGVLERRRRIGTRVSDQMHCAASRVNIPVLRHIVEAGGRQHRFHYLGRSGNAPPAVVRERLFLSRPEDLVEHVTLHYADEDLLCVERRWVDTAALLTPPEMTAEITFNEWLARHVELTRIERHVVAKIAGEVGAAELLGCDAGAAVLVYRTCAWIGPRPVCCTGHIFPPGFALDDMLP